MIIVVTGGRDYQGDVDIAMETFNSTHAITLLIHGGARGADSRAAMWARKRGIHTAELAPLWDLFGRKAGHLRNRAMASLKPEYCIKFPGGSGTADMVKICEGQSVPVYIPYG